MASYTAAANIQSEFKDITFSTTTAVTTADITQFLAEADAEINSKLAVKYLTPITGTESLVLMGMIEVWLVKDRILEILRVKSGTQKADQGSENTGKSYRQKALDLLALFASGKAILTDATLASSSDGVKSYSNDNDLDHTFQVGVTQW